MTVDFEELIKTEEKKYKNILEQCLTTTGRSIIEDNFELAVNGASYTENGTWIRVLYNPGDTLCVRMGKGDTILRAADDVSHHVAQDIIVDFLLCSE